MQIELTNIGKRFKREWIFRNLNYSITNPSIVGITGPNGSGKSTLIKIMSQAELPSEGEVSFKNGDSSIPADKAFSFLSIAAPYIDLPEQLTLKEAYEFHIHFKQLNYGLGLDNFLKQTYLQDASQKVIKNFSSGMKQRLKLGFAILSDTPILLLDEPCSNLDNRGVDFYHQLLEENSKNRMILIGTNEPEKELVETYKKLNLLDFK